MVHAQAGDNIDLRWVVSVTFLVEVNRLELVLLLLVEVAHLSEDFRIARHLGDQNVVPLKSLATHADKLVDVSDLVQNLVTVGDDRVQLLEGLEGFIVVSEALVDETKIVDSLDAVSFDTNGLKEELLRSIKIFVHKERVTLVYESL